jgi:hypothetical protein
MARYRCPRCHEITYRPELFAFCGICSAPLSARDLESEEPEGGYEHALEPAAPVEASAREGHAVG